MIKDSAKKGFEVVIVWKLDRFSRNRFDAANYKNQHRKNGVKLLSATEDISEGPEDILFESIIEGFAEYFSAELAVKVTRGMVENALKASYFVPVWDFDRKRNGWNICYREQRDITISKGIFSYSNKIDEFQSVLIDIGSFAEKIGFPYFSDVFHKAYEGLCDFAKIDEPNVPKHIPDEFKGIYYAVETADVFGAMGSWNDSPPCYAEQMGLGKEYNELSDRLFKQLRYHLMCVTNQCWQKK